MATSKPLSQDNQARNDIVEKLNKNIFVIAGAGSGKTAMLVNRMVSLIENGVDGIEVTIDQICAITFTINAAAEFLGRLKEVLNRRASGIPNGADDWPGGLGVITDEKKARDKKALENIDLCFAGTIDSFCNLMLSEYPLNADVPSSSSVMQDDEASAFYKKEYQRLSELYKNHDSFKAFVKLFSDPANVFSTSINEAINASFLDAKYIVPTKSIDQFVIDFKNKYELGLKKDFKAMVNAEPIVNGSKESLNAYAKFRNRNNKLGGNWDLKEILEVSEMLSDLGSITFTSDVLGLTYLDYPQDKKLYKFKEDCPIVDIVKEIKKAIHGYAVDFLMLCAEEVRKELKSQGKLTFDEYLYTFKELIKKDLNTAGSPIIKHIKKRFKYFLLDESQDTSPFQYELFLFLNSLVPTTKIDDVVMEKGSLFIVGDPKQSIYRFRSADIKSYEKVESLFTNVNNANDSEVLTLTYNFRCSKSLCEYFNNQFTNCPSTKLDKYTLIDNIGDRPDKNQGLYTCIDYVDVIKTIANNPHYLINGKSKSDDPRKIKYQDIMIICKGVQDRLSVVSRELDKEGIPCYSDDDNRLNDYQIVEAIYAIYSFIAYPDNSGYEYNLLTSPLFGLDKKEALSTNRFLSLSDEQKKILDVVDGCRTINDPVSLLDKIINDIDILKYVTSKKLEFAYYVLNKFKEAYAGQQILSIQDGAEFLKGLMVEAQERIASLQFKPNAVRISNVHKVKGLEAPVVILIKAGIDNNPSSKITSHKDYSSNSAYLIRLSKRENYGSRNITYNIDNSINYENELTAELNEKKEEEKRLKYVAVTRARDYLFIQDVPGAKGGNYWKDLISESFFEEFVPDPTQIEKFNASRVVVPDNQVYGPKASPVFDTNESYQIVLPSKLKLNSEVQSDEHDIKDQDSNTAAEKGTLVHALMEIYVSSNFKYSSADVVEETLSRYGQSRNDEYRQMLTKVINTMTSGGYPQVSGQKEDLISVLKNASEIYCEMPFSYQEGNDIYNGSIDLFYKLGDQYYIVDYKTNYDDTNLDITYENQLEAYKKAVKNIMGIDAAARIYHIDIK